ncbi:MAG: hypothetical protein ACFFD2_06410 [Promethearchaeota archaeon]
MKIEYYGTMVELQDGYVECLSKDCNNCKFNEEDIKCDLCGNSLKCCGALVQEYYREMKKLPLIIPCCYCNAELKAVRSSYKNR